MDLTYKTLKELDEIEIDFIRNIGGYHNLSEFDYFINDISRAKIIAFSKENERCWLGKFDLKHLTVEEVDIKDMLTEFQGQRIHNFEYEFIIASYDAKIVKMLKDYNKLLLTNSLSYFNADIKNALSHIDKIYDRVNQLNGCILVWV